MTSPGALPTREEIAEILSPHLGAGSSSPGVIADALLARLRPAWDSLKREHAQFLADLRNEEEAHDRTVVQHLAEKEKADALRADLKIANDAWAKAVADQARHAENVLAEQEQWHQVRGYLLGDIESFRADLERRTTDLECEQMDNGRLRADVARLERQVNASVAVETYKALVLKLGEVNANLQGITNALRNLLATIHRDGGHHATAHGDEKSAEIAMSVVLDEREDLRACAEALDRILPAMVTVTRWIEDHESDLPGLEDDIHNLADAVDQARAALARPGLQEQKG